MKQKKEYMRPTMMVVELKQTGILMASDPQQQDQKQQYESEEWF